MNTFRTSMMRHYFVLFLIATSVLTSCFKENDEGDKNDDVNQSVYSIMKMYYLWESNLPGINPLDFNTPQEVLEKLRDPRDRWSNLMDREEFYNYFSGGEYIGHGIGLAGDANGKLVVSFVYDNSPLKSLGVERGWIIESLNGTSIAPGVDIGALFGNNVVGVRTAFVFKDLEGVSHSITSQKKVISLNTVLNHQVITTGSRKVGYLAFQSFISTSREELNAAFSDFNSQGIQELVVDLRYNGGGQLDITGQLAGLIASANHGGKDFIKIQHNGKVSMYDTVYTIPTGISSPTLTRIFCIATRNTASASEALINGMEPWMDVQVVGDSTHGKAAGMYSFDLDPYGLVFMPVCFKLSNANNFGDYFSGLPADFYEADDLQHALGSPEEACLKGVLQYIEAGSYPARKSARTKGVDLGLDRLTGLRAQNPIF